MRPEGLKKSDANKIKKLIMRYPVSKAVHRNRVFPCAGEYHSQYEHRIQPGTGIAYNPPVF
jgi:hypothetical protein